MPDEMEKIYYARFNGDAAQPTPVITWYDMQFHDYILPEERHLIRVSDADWALHMRQTGGWIVKDGKLVPPKGVFG